MSESVVRSRTLNNRGGNRVRQPGTLEKKTLREVFGKERMVFLN